MSRFGKGEVMHAAYVLREGGIVAFPSETVYGLAADAMNVVAVARSFYVKKKPISCPMIVYVAEAGDVARLTRKVPPIAVQLAERFWPGPLTIVLPKSAVVPDLVTVGAPLVALRVPQHPMARSLLKAVGSPLAVTSANPFGYLSSTTAAQVAQHFGDCVDVLLDGGPCLWGLESTIVSLTTRRPTVLRLGSVSVEDLERCVGPLGASIDECPLAIDSHSRRYAPKTPLFLDAKPDSLLAAGLRVGLLAFNETIRTGRWLAQEVLPLDGSLANAARGLYAALHRLDDAGLDAIVAERAPDRGLGRAVNDRLLHAAWRSQDLGTSSQGRRSRVSIV